MLRSILSLALIASLATVSLAQPPGRDGDRPQRGRGDAAKGDAAKGDSVRGKGEARRGGNRPEGMDRRGGPMMQADPEVVAAKMMEQFDKDGDSKLNSNELVALLKSLRERMQSGRQGMQGRPGAQGARGQRPDGMQQRRGERQGQGKRTRGRDGADATPGGDKPKRPGSNGDA